jgi:hypothetical protein
VEFEDYLISKNIDAYLFKSAEPAVFQEWKEEFKVMHPESFTTQKKFKINPIRRKYQLLKKV